MKKNHVFKSAWITLIFGAIYYYVVLPPIHLQSIEFYFSIFLLVGIFVFFNVVFSKKKIQEIKRTGWAVLLPIVVVLCYLISVVVFSPLVNAKLYANRISIDETKTFSIDVEEVNFSQLPLLDRDSTEKLGDRVMGQMAEWVSQFYVSDLYTQINYQQTIVRSTPLEYNGMIKYFVNKRDGVPAYITVNSVSGEAKLVKLEQGMKYMPSAMFSEDLYRKIRFQFPFTIFGSAQFELDETGAPYWIVPTYNYQGIGMLEDINGVIIVNPINGEANMYSLQEVPRWVDHVFSPSLVIEQANDWGSYRGGFLNSVFGQKNVVQTTDGYNYLAMNDDIYLYTGITSVLADESNLGFILSNMRTKETCFYQVAGAEEFSAMSSAQGQVQQMKYTASFPLLINLKGKPTYVMSMKDNAGLVKMYAFVDVQDYQRVVVTNASEGIVKAAENYLGSSLEEETITNEDLTFKEITVSFITMATDEGTSFYYILDEDGNKYKISLAISDLLPFVKEGDLLEVGYLYATDVTTIIALK